MKITNTNLAIVASLLFEAASALPYADYDTSSWKKDAYSWINSVGKSENGQKQDMKFKTDSSLIWKWGGSDFNAGGRSKYAAYCPQFSSSWGADQYHYSEDFCEDNQFKYWMPACQSGFKTSPQIDPNTYGSAGSAPGGSKGYTNNPMEDIKPRTVLGYTQVFDGLTGSMLATGYNTYTEPKTGYNITECIEYCNGDFAQSCQFVDLYYEINTVDGSKVAKCALYDTIHYAEVAVNYHPTSASYNVMNSTGYANYNWKPPVVPGYSETFTNLTSSVSTRDKLSSMLLPPFIPQDCADKCTATAGCAFFNIYRSQVGPDAYAPICDLYAFSHAAEDCKSSYVVSQNQTISGSYGFVNSMVVQGSRKYKEYKEDKEDKKDKKDK